MPWDEQTLVNELTSMGFGQDLARRAVHETRDDGSQSAALDWVLSHSQSQPPSRATTPRAGATRPDASAPSGVDLDEEMMLAAAIQESLAPTSSAKASLTEEEQLQLALSASIAEDARSRAESDADIANQLAQLQMAPSWLLPDDEPEETGPIPPLPESYVNDARAEEAAKRRLERGAPNSILTITKAGVLLRRRASVARARSYSGGQPLITADGQPAHHQRQRAQTQRLPPGYPPGIAPRGGAISTRDGACLHSLSAPSGLVAADERTEQLAQLKAKLAAGGFAGAAAQVRADAAAAAGLPASSAGATSSTPADGSAAGAGQQSSSSGLAEFSAAGATLPDVEAAIVRGKKLLGERLRNLRLESVSVKDDGACQFRAFSQQLYGTQEHHRAVRAKVVQHMRQEETFFGAMFDEGELPIYLQTMDRSRTWGDELTLRAFADSFSVCVHVVASTDQNWHLVYWPPEGMKVRKHVFLTYLSPVHYDALSAVAPFDESQRD